MSQDDFQERLKRVKARSKFSAADEPIGQRRADMATGGGGGDEDNVELAKRILLPQLAFILGALALVAGRSIAMSQFGIETSTQTLSPPEGAIVLVLLVIIGLVFGKSNYVSHIAMAFGAALAFLTESYYITAMPDLMAQIYTPEYVTRVTLGLQ